MPYSFRSRAKRENRRLMIIVAAVTAILIVAFLMYRSGDEDAPQPPVLGVRDSAYLSEEIGVFEFDTTGYGDVPTTPLPDADPDSTRVAARERAISDMPAYHSEMLRKPQSALAANNYAWSLHLVGRYADSEAYLREVIRMAPDRAIAYANLGESLWKQGKNEEAAAMYRRFLELNTDPRRERIAQQKVAQITGRPSPP